MLISDYPSTNISRKGSLGAHFGQLKEYFIDALFRKSLKKFEAETITDYAAPVNDTLFYPGLSFIWLKMFTFEKAVGNTFDKTFYQLMFLTAVGKNLGDKIVIRRSSTFIAVL